MPDYRSAGRYAGAVATLVLVRVAVKELYDWFNENKKIKLQFVEDLYVYKDGNGKLIFNTDGKGELIAQNYIGSDGATYQLCGDNNWYKLSGSTWVKV